MSVRRNSRRNSPRARRGAAAVEFAVVAPLIFLLMFGIIEIGRMMMVKHYAINASREAARKAVLPNADAGAIEAAAMSELSAASVHAAQVTFTPADLSAAPQGSQVVVSVEVNPEDVSWLPSTLYMGGKRIEASTTMRKEY